LAYQTQVNEKDIRQVYWNVIWIAFSKAKVRFSVLLISKNSFPLEPKYTYKNNHED